MSFSPPTLDVRSPLLQTGLADDRFHVTDYMGDGAYPGHRAEKDEAERYVASVVAAMDRGEAPQLPDDVRHYLRAMFPPDELELASAEADLFARQVGFAALQRAVDEALYELEDRSFEAPTAADPVFARSPSLFERVTKDGLVRLRRGDVTDEALRGEGVFRVDGTAIYPHPMLAPARELVVELLALALEGDLTVAIAVHPFRVTAVEDVQFRLLEDYWYGVTGRRGQPRFARPTRRRRADVPRGAPGHHRAFLPSVARHVVRLGAPQSPRRR